MEELPLGQPIKVIGRYALYGKLAAGGMATVHFGRLQGPAGFSRTVAIKRLHPQFAKDPEFVAMFLDEARVAARIQHPNVVATVDVVAMAEELFLVMDYIRGESFSRLLRASRKKKIDVPLGIVASVVAGMLHGLHAAHEAKDEQGRPLGVVHRDVSPQNVLVGADGVPRVLDFGVAKAAARIQVTRDGQMKGKLCYMAPEQLKGQGVDRRTDVFAAAIVLWEALTGRRLFDAEEPQEVLRMITTEEIPPPSAVVPSIPRGVDAVVMKGLARNVDERYQTARQFAIALEDVTHIASTREVGEWVERVAGETLQDREQAVAEIEAISSVSDVSSPSGIGPPGFTSTLVGQPPPPKAKSGTPERGAAAASEWEEGPTRIYDSSADVGIGLDNATKIQVPNPPPAGRRSAAGLPPAARVPPRRSKPPAPPEPRMFPPPDEPRMFPPPEEPARSPLAAKLPPRDAPRAAAASRQSSVSTSPHGSRPPLPPVPIPGRASVVPPEPALRRPPLPPASRPPDASRPALASRPPLSRALLVPDAADKGRGVASTRAAPSAYPSRPGPPALPGSGGPRRSAPPVPAASFQDEGERTIAREAGGGFDDENEKTIVKDGTDAVAAIAAALPAAKAPGWDDENEKTIVKDGTDAVAAIAAALPVAKAPAWDDENEKTTVLTGAGDELVDAAERLSKSPPKIAVRREIPVPRPAAGAPPSAPMNVIVSEHTSPAMLRQRPGPLMLASAWLFASPTARARRVGLVAGVAGLFVGVALFAARGKRTEPSHLVEERVEPAKISLSAPPKAAEPRGIDPAQLPEAPPDEPAEPASAKASKVETLPKTAALRVEKTPEAKHEAPSAPEPKPAEAKPEPPKPVEPPAPSPAANDDSPHAAVPKAKPAPPPPAAAKAPPPPAKATASSCAEPFTIDDKGIKRIKPECL